MTKNLWPLSVALALPCCGDECREHSDFSCAYLKTATYSVVFWLSPWRPVGNAEKVRRGIAWVYTRYVPMGSTLYELEAYARLRHLRLWSDVKPVAPWERRAVKR